MDAAAFIRHHTVCAAPDFVPEIALHLAAEITPVWQASEDWLQLKNAEPPFWAFAWAGGQGLARYILDHPEKFQGRHILDLAAGCGIAAIAARLAGATTVTAVEIDRLAAAAIILNAARNAVTVEVVCRDMTDEDVTADCLIAGDICYAQTMAARLLPWLRRQAARGVAVYLGDPGRTYFPIDGYEICAEYSVPVALELEDRTTRVVRVVRLLS